jgi:multisubunit Na+/H+ antiporter MnhB subunit
MVILFALVRTHKPVLERSRKLVPALGVGFVAVIIVICIVGYFIAPFFPPPWPSN